MCVNVCVCVYLNLKVRKGDSWEGWKRGKGNDITILQFQNLKNYNKKVHPFEFIFANLGDFLTKEGMIFFCILYFSSYHL